MALPKALAGFTGTESDYFRKAIKLKDPVKFEKWKEKFVSGCKKYSKIDKKTALKIWEYIEKFSGYGFNRAHGAAYALVAYMNCYLKAHYPAEFMTAVISHNVDDDKKLSVYLTECKRLGLKIYKPHINKSQDVFKLSSGGVLYPLTAIKKVGGKAVERLILLQNKKKFKSFEDFVTRATHKDHSETSSPVNLGVITNLILANSFRRWGTIEEIFDKYMNYRNDKHSFKQMYCDMCGKRFPVSTNKKKLETEGICCPNCDTPYHADEALEIVSKEVCKGTKFDRSYIQYEVFGFTMDSSKLKRFTDILAKEKAIPIQTAMEMKSGTVVKIGF